MGRIALGLLLSAAVMETVSVALFQTLYFLRLYSRAIFWSLLLFHIPETPKHCQVKLEAVLGNVKFAFVTGYCSSARTSTIVLNVPLSPDIV